jgi:hypothetical protein
MAEPTAQRLEAVMDLRDKGLVPSAQIVDSRYQDLMDDPVAARDAFAAGKVHTLWGTADMMVLMAPGVTNLDMWPPICRIAA